MTARNDQAVRYNHCLQPKPLFVKLEKNTVDELKKRFGGGVDNGGAKVGKEVHSERKKAKQNASVATNEPKLNGRSLFPLLPCSAHTHILVHTQTQVYLTRTCSYVHTQMQPHGTHRHSRTAIVLAFEKKKEHTLFSPLSYLFVLLILL